MDRQQFEIAREIINNDCTITRRLRDGEGGFCAVGGLYTALDPGWAMGASRTRGVEYEEVAKAFGLPNARSVTVVNDTYADLYTRRASVIAYLETLVEEE